MRRRLTRIATDEDGQAIVELALVLPILLVIVLAIFDFGRAVNYWNSETSLANVGARYAAVGAALPTSGACSGSTSSLTSYIQCQAGQYGLKDATAGSPGLQPPTSGSTVNVCVSVPNNKVGQPVTVEVSGGYDWLPVPHLFAHLNQVNLTGTATMRIENTLPPAWITTTSSCP